MIIYKPNLKIEHKKRTSILRLFTDQPYLEVLIYLKIHIVRPLTINLETIRSFKYNAKILFNYNSLDIVVKI